MSNQCDGCARNLPITEGLHFDGRKPFMACSKSKYDNLKKENAQWREANKIITKENVELLKTKGDGYTLHASSMKTATKEVKRLNTVIAKQKTNIYKLAKALGSLAEGTKFWYVTDRYKELADKYKEKK